MRLSSSRVERTLEQFPGQPIPDNHPSVAELNRVFGDHTFFLDESGLHIVEPTVAEVDGVETGQLIKLASWDDANRTRLAAHEPEPTDIIVEFGPDRSGLPH
jgi:hypothetical protein